MSLFQSGFLTAGQPLVVATLEFLLIGGGGGGGSTNIYQNTSITAVSSVTLGNSWAFNIYFDGTQWMEH